MFRIESCAKQQIKIIQINDRSAKMASAKIPTEQHSDFRWRRAKAWRRPLPCLWIDCGQGSLPNPSQMKAMSESYLETCLDWTSFDFRFKDFFCNQPLKIIIYCVTDQPSKTRFRRSFSLFCWNVSREKYLNSNYVECDNICRSKVCGQELWYILSLTWAWWTWEWRLFCA